MVNLTTLLNNIESILGSYPFLFIAILISFVLKTCILIILIKRGFHNTYAKYPWLFLLGVLTSAIVGDFAWLLKLLQILFFPQMDYRIILFSIRIAWGFTVMQYNALSLFIESLVDQKYFLKMALM